eukprot:jgi/Botrbrau1/20856/Bobra.0561s0001.1
MLSRSSISAEVKHCLTSDFPVYQQIADLPLFLLTGTSAAVDSKKVSVKETKCKSLTCTPSAHSGGAGAVVSGKMFTIRREMQEPSHAHQYQHKLKYKIVIVY